MFQKGFAANLNTYLIFIFGILGFLAPPFSIVIATLNGKSTISMLNSTMIMILSLLIIVFFVIKAFDLFFSRKKNLFILNLIFLIIIVLSFLLHLSAFLKL